MKLKKININKNRGIAYMLLFLISLFASYFDMISFDKISSLYDRKEYQPTYEKELLEEINFIYIGSSQCGFSNNDEMFAAVDKSIYKVKTVTDSLNLGFSALGIAAEWDVESGLQHLNNISKFNEISIGNNWGNSTIVKIISEFNIEPSTPQILITKRKYSSNSLYVVESEKIIKSIIGKDNIINWVNNNSYIESIK